MIRVTQVPALHEYDARPEAKDPAGGMGHVLDRPDLRARKDLGFGEVRRDDMRPRKQLGAQRFNRVLLEQSVAALRNHHRIDDDVREIEIGNGSADGLDTRHLTRLKHLVDWLEPALVSEHLSWSVAGGVYLNHLLPLPYTDETLEIVCRHVEAAQTILGRRLLVENPSNYLRFAVSSIPEPEFLAAVVRRTDCGLLCDVNNIYVTSRNFGQDPVAYLEKLPPEAVNEIHLAGHTHNGSHIVDTHDHAIVAGVWDLYAEAVRLFPGVPTMIERDADIPPYAELLAELDQARAIAAHAVRPSRAR